MLRRFFLPVLLVLFLAAFSAAADCPNGNCGQVGPLWQQPTRQQPIRYPTPLRSWLFGAYRTIPTGPPAPYMLVPGRVVWPQLVYPREQVPEIVWPR